jgi:hypothetical protein
MQGNKALPSGGMELLLYRGAKRKSETGLSGQDRQNGKARTEQKGQKEQDSRYSTALTRQQE